MSQDRIAVAGDLGPLADATREALERRGHAVLAAPYAALVQMRLEELPTRIIWFPFGPATDPRGRR